jgi:uncharacterized protein (TIGR00106 family)
MGLGMHILIFSAVIPEADKSLVYEPLVHFRFKCLYFEFYMEDIAVLASFSIVPIGVGEELKEHVAMIIDLVDQSGMKYKAGAMQTTVEGESQQVMDLIMTCHGLMKEKASRVLTHIVIDDRTGAENRLAGKVKDVENVLKRKVNHE